MQNTQNYMKYMYGNGFENLYADTHTLNTVAGNLQNITTERLKNQLEFISSEVQETIEAFKANDKVEMLDGCVDVIVTTMGLMQMLEKLYNADLEQAMKRVGENNLTKFPIDEEIAKETCKLNPGWSYSYNWEFSSFVIKDSDGKIRKPCNYESVDLTGCFPTLN